MNLEAAEKPPRVTAIEVAGLWLWNQVSLQLDGAVRNQDSLGKRLVPRCSKDDRIAAGRHRECDRRMP